MRVFLVLHALLLCAVSASAQHVCVLPAIILASGDALALDSECRVLATVPFTFTLEDSNDLGRLATSVGSVDSMRSSFIANGSTRSKDQSTPKQVTDALRFWTQFIDAFRDLDAPRGRLCARHRDWLIIDYEIDVNRLWVKSTFPKSCKAD